MVCPKCGTANPDVAQFCGRCGSALTAAAPPPPAPTGSSAGVRTETKVIVIVATVIIPLVGIIMGIVYMNSGDPGKKAVGRTWLLVGIGIMLVYCILSGALNNIARM